MGLEQVIKEEAARQGFSLAGITTPDPPAHLEFFERWLAAGRHGEMAYLASEHSRQRRADPRLLLPECRSILVLGVPYYPSRQEEGEKGEGNKGSIAAYAWGEDYHSVLKERLQRLAAFIESQVGHPVPSRVYTDSAPLLERELAQRAGLGWIGKNTCLIHPRLGSYFFLAEVLLGIALQADPPFTVDHCGSCTRCMEACPTGCIGAQRSLDARGCIAYLTIELKGAIPEELRPALGNRIFGCDVCQQVCPWNRFAPARGDQAFAPRQDVPAPDLPAELGLTADGFRRKFANSPVLRAKRSGYLRNVAVALGNVGEAAALPALEWAARANLDALVREHAQWAVERVKSRIKKGDSSQSRKERRDI